MNLKMITNIVICYENEDEVLKYAKHLQRQVCEKQIKLLVVVNRFKYGIDYLYSKLEQIGLCFDIVDPGKNLGYLNGLIYGYKHSKEKSSWYIFSNTDIKLNDTSFISDFFKSDYSKDNDIWVVGPSVCVPNKNEFSNPYLEKRPTKYFYIIKNFGMTFPLLYDYLFRLKAKIKKTNLQKKKDSSIVYAVHGSYIFLREELLAVLSRMDEWELLYDEEQYIAEIVRKMHKKTAYASSIEVIHLEGATTNKVAVKRRYQRMKKANKRILKEFYSK